LRRNQYQAAVIEKKWRDNAALGVVMLRTAIAPAVFNCRWRFLNSTLESTLGMSFAVHRISQDFELSLRPATEADVDALMRLRRSTMTEHLQRAGAASDEAALLARVTYHLEDGQLVYLGDQLVGLFKTYRNGSEWHLVQVQIAPQWQGKGLGERLVRGLLERAAEENCSVVLDVLAGNPAKRLYDRLGFVVEHQSAMEHHMRWTPPGRAA
jgi:ribosomal protein S18 acetylase RimI-like enzyme